MNRDIDGFELYGTAQIPSMWDLVSGVSTIDNTGRNGNCLTVISIAEFTHPPASVRRNYVDMGRIFAGFAFRCTDLPAIGTRMIVALASTGEYLSGLWYDAAGRLLFGYLATPSDLTSFVQVGAATPAGTIKAGVWRSLRMDVTLDNAAGAVQVYVGRTLRISNTGIKTSNLAGAGATVCNQIELRGSGEIGSAGHSFDDYWVNDATGDNNNTLWPDVQVFGQTSRADGHTAAWTPVGADDCYECLQTADGDTSYIISDTDGQVNLCALTPPPGTIGTIKAVQTRLVGRLDGVDAIGVKPMISDGATDNAGAAVDLATDDETIRTTYDINPITSAPWTIENLTALQIGAKVSV